MDDFTDLVTENDDFADLVTENRVLTNRVHVWTDLPPSYYSSYSWRNVNQNIAAASSGVFLGKDTSIIRSAGTDIYTKFENLPTATASILNHAQKRANFHPAIETPEQLASKFNDYIREIDNSPFFSLTENERTHQSMESKDYNKLIDHIASLYDGVSEQDKQKMKTAISDMAKSVFSESNSTNSKTLFSQSTINYDNPNKPYIYIYYTELNMKHNDSGKSEVSEQSYTVNKTKYQVLRETIMTYAGELTKLDEKDVNSWVSGITSKGNKIARALCFPSEPYKSP